MSSRPWNNGTDTTVAYMHPQKPVGTIVFNGRLNTTLASMAKTRTNPQYDRGLGSTIDNMDYVKDGDLLYTFSGTGASIHAMSRSSHRNDYTAVQCLSVLNGQGEAGMSNDALMTTIEFVGVCEMGTKVTGNSLFNIIRGGIRTMLNNGTETVNVGDWLMIYAPTQKEVRERAGGSGLVDDDNGEVKLQMRPFRVEMHKHTPKAVYECLRRMSEADTPFDASAVTASGPGEGGYSLEFAESCLDFLESAMQLAALGRLAAGGTEQEAQDLYDALAADRVGFMNVLFEAYRADWSPPPGSAEPRLPRTLSTFRKEAVGLHLFSVGRFCDALMSRIFGKAMTTAMPKHNVSVHIKPRQ